MHSRGLYIQTENESTIDIMMVTPDGKEERISTLIRAVCTGVELRPL